MHKLDNPVWHALAGQQQSLSTGGALARRFPTDVSPLAALADPHDPAGWSELAEIAGGDGSKTSVCLFNVTSDAPPPGWETEWRYRCAQMVCSGESFRAPADDGSGLSIRALTLDDGAAMVALAGQTQSGPMALQTVRLGGYLGIFAPDGALVAMTGRRMHLDGLIEVSGVGTDPRYRGNGYARVLVALVTRQILDSGNDAFLHVREDNAGAIRVYRELGFYERSVFDIAAFKPT